jgi:hypothetical protein
MAKSRAKSTGGKSPAARTKVVSRSKAPAPKLAPVAAKGRLRAVVPATPAKSVPPAAAKTAAPVAAKAAALQVAAKAATPVKPVTAVRRVPSSEPPAAGATKADGLKARFAQLSSATSQISGLKRAMNKNFFDVGVILNRIRNERLYEVKGYGSFESFVERELEINKVVCLRSARIAEAMIRDVALEAGLERASAAVAALDGESAPPASIASFAGPSGAVLPFHKQ